MDIVLIIGLCLFTFSSIFFAYQGGGKFSAPFFVSIVTLVSYIVMFEGGFIFQDSSGNDIYWTRWIGYAFSCSFLMYTITSRLNFMLEQKLNIFFLNSFVMLTGALSAIFTGYFMLALFAVSSVAYLLMIWPILNSKDSNLLIKNTILFGWTAFPVIFILSPEGYGIINNIAAFSVYLFLDAFTKVAFYFLLGKPK